MTTSSVTPSSVTNNSSASSADAASFLDTLNSGAPYALVFAGQASPWQESLREQLLDPTLTSQIDGLIRDSDQLLAPLATRLAAIGGAGLTTHQLQATDHPYDAVLSVPGIVASQVAQIQAISWSGLDFSSTPPVAVLGHSQGVLAVAYAKARLKLTGLGDKKAADELSPAQVFAIARLIGAAASRTARHAGVSGYPSHGPALGAADSDEQQATPMLAINGATAEQVKPIIDQATAEGSSVRLALVNARTSLVVSGKPSDLENFKDTLAVAETRYNKTRTDKLRGGAPLAITTEYLPVTVPFHNELMEPAVQQTIEWAQACDLSAEAAEKLARAVLTDHIDWPAQIREALDADAKWFLDVGPGTAVGTLVHTTLEGTGAGVVPLGDLDDIDQMCAPGEQPSTTADWSAWAPKLIHTAAGPKVETAFTRLTGNSPVMLAGMTPTTVDPEIVSAAANAGYWAELAGGGQVTEPVFAKHLAQLREQLEPGRTAKFNAMFMDRYLWNLHFGAQRIVTKARQSGAPIDGVVITAGIPELDEAPELIAELQGAGFRYIAFKPGTTTQIASVLAIARVLEDTDTTVIMQVEDGHAGGHHSWETLSDLLLATYADIREQSNVVLCVGGGIGTPDKAADYITGQWSVEHGVPAMPVDGVLIGTGAMTAKEARTTESVKDLLVATDGVPVEDNNGWVGRGKSNGGMTSGMSHLRADLYEIDNAAARCARLIMEVEGDSARVAARRDELIEAMNQTAKPYFGDLEDMTYAQVVNRFVELSFPFVDPSWQQRFWELLQRVEARLSDADHGPVATMFASVDEVSDAKATADKLLSAFPEAEKFYLTAQDVAWFVALCRKYPKPMGFVPRLDDDLLRWWGQDSLWQAQDPRYTADQVRIIPGPMSVRGIKSKNEPIAELLGRFDAEVRAQVAEVASEEKERVSRLASAENDEELLRAVPFISWMGHLIDNPANLLDRDAVDIEFDEVDGKRTATLRIKLDTYWDDAPDSVAQASFAVRELTFPLLLTDALADGGVPVIDQERLPDAMFAQLAGTAGVGNTAVTGDKITGLPTIESSERSESGEAHYSFTLSADLGADHTSVTGTALGSQSDLIVPDALLGPCWPAIYAALGSAQVNDYPVIEGLLNAVHLDHRTHMIVPVTELADKLSGATVNVTSWADAVEESASGRVVQVNLELAIEGETIATMVERFAIRGRAFGTNLPADPPLAGGIDAQVEDTPRSTLLRAVAKAPSDMTPFAWVSGDFNPIHTSHAAAKVAGLEAPLVHGMWLSAVAQHAAAAAAGAPGDDRRFRLLGWTYRMFGLVQLDEEVQVSVERVGRINGGGLVLEVNCRVGEQLVSQATAITDVPRTAYVYPGQGIQSAGMGLDERTKSQATAAVWDRADAHTREALGFSILAVVRDNPTTLVAGGQTFRHPEGVLNLTQFTQVALATLAFAQTARLREAGALNDGAFFAGHSLGEYNALSAYADSLDLETVLELVFHRGTTMHNLVPRDEQGRSNYRMGALRPNQFGVGDDGVREYVASVAEKTGEFLEIVNFNLEGQQYAVAGTVSGIKALEKDANRRSAEAGGKGAFMLVPGIDVPFHSAVLHDGVPDFRAKLQELVPQTIDPTVLVGRYIPNLVARPFELTEDFLKSILDVVPSEPVQKIADEWADWSAKLADDAQCDAAAQELTRELLIELLCWQFASPVRWIETQSLLLGAKSNGPNIDAATSGATPVEEYIEIGLGAAPTLANLGAKTLSLPGFANSLSIVRNVQRDEAAVYHEDVRTIDLPESTDLEDATASAEELVADQASEAGAVADAEAAGDMDNAPAQAQEPAAPAATPAAAMPAAPAGNAADNPELDFTAADALRTLLAYAAKVRLDQVGDADTTGSLTNGVSSRLNQLLMDMSAELGLSSVEGAAEADVATLSATVNKAAFNYKPFGPVLSEAIKDRVRKLFGAAGAKQSLIAEHVESEWGLSAGWAAHATATILLSTREGASTRGGDLATLAAAPGGAAPTNKAGVLALIDEAIQETASARGLAVAKKSAGAAGGGAAVDSAALDAFKDKVIGDRGILANSARALLGQLDLNQPVAEDFDHSEASETQAVLDAVAEELGSNWPSLVAPVFDEARAVLIDDRWATAREDVARIAAGEFDSEAATGEGLPNFTGTGAIVARQARWWVDNLASELSNVIDADTLAARKRALETVVEQAEDTSVGEYAGKIAVVIGMAPSSIAGGVVERLLAGGATVVATASRISESRLSYAKNLVRNHGRDGAALWLVPANLASYRDVDALVNWIGSEQSETVGSETKVIKPVFVPDLYFPFAAPPVMGTAQDAGAATEHQTRLLLWSVERSMTALAQIGSDYDVDHRLHVVLPGSPNRGTFGGDGAYGETKAAFDAIANKWAVEPWSAQVTLAHPRIGWVAGTGLMGGNDPLVDVAKAKGVHVWSPQEISENLLELCTEDALIQARTEVLESDLTGGLGNISLPALAAEAAAESITSGAADAAAGDGLASEEKTTPATVMALPTPAQKLQPQLAGDWGTTTATLEDTYVIVGLGEVSPWGSGRTRFEAEYGVQTSGDVDLTAAGVLELAWMTGLLTWKESPKAGWYDDNDELVDEADIYARFRDEVIARSGVREFITDAAINGAADGETGPHGEWPNSPEAVEMFLDRDVTFSVDTEDEARQLVEADPQFTVATFVTDDDGSGEWQITRTAGARARVPRRATLARRVGGQFPTDFDPARWGIPQDMVDSMDRMAVWNLVTTVDAYLSAGFSPAEILQAVHPSEVAMTQGTGFGGMTSMRRLFVERFLGEDIPSDILQETLPNVIAAHTMQSFVGGYGAMIHPVGACATAAVSIEEGVDKMACGKADFVVAGAVDDISVESITGFANMNATADSTAMSAKGIDDGFFSRANDRRRGGFVEAQGGGTVLLTRGSIAAELGLPVFGVVGYAQSFADGVHTSIPAPSLGALAAARGGKDSRLARSLAALGVSADDIAVVSKHDTSTNANDPNESDLHTRLANQLGRTPGNPMYVVSQKTLTGHAKGGAAVFQVAGLVDMFRTGRVPANKALDCVDPEMKTAEHFVWLREPLQAPTAIKAGLVTSLGFGHVSAVVALVHPAAFEAVLAAERGQDTAATWRERANGRLTAGARHVEAGMLGRRELFTRIDDRRFASADHDADTIGDAEAAMLLDPNARLGEDGLYANYTK